ncbi:unnamed protein product [Boreogadus saida]
MRCAGGEYSGRLFRASPPVPAAATATVLNSGYLAQRSELSADGIKPPFTDSNESLPLPLPPLRKVKLHSLPPPIITGVSRSHINCEGADPFRQTPLAQNTVELNVLLLEHSTALRKLLTSKARKRGGKEEDKCLGALGTESTGGQSCSSEE